MRKIFITIGLILLFIIIYLLQANFFSWFNFGGVRPNLFIIYILTIGLFAGKWPGMGFGIFFGLILDFFIGKNIGIFSIMLGTIGGLGGYLDKSFSKDSRITILTMIGISTIIYEIGVVVLNFFINNSQISIAYLIKTLTIELIFNSIIAIIIYTLIIKFGYILEKNFKSNKTLTRYF